MELLQEWFSAELDADLTGKLPQSPEDMLLWGSCHWWPQNMLPLSASSSSL